MSSSVVRAWTLAGADHAAPAGRAFPLREQRIERGVHHVPAKCRHERIGAHERMLTGRHRQVRAEDQIGARIHGHAEGVSHADRQRVRLDAEMVLRGLNRPAEGGKRGTDEPRHVGGAADRGPGGVGHPADLVQLHP